MPRQLTCARSWRVAQTWDSNNTGYSLWCPLCARHWTRHLNYVISFSTHENPLNHSPEDEKNLRPSGPTRICVREVSEQQSLKRGKENVPSVIYLLSGWLTAVTGILRGNGASRNILSERNLDIPKCCWGALRNRGSRQDGVLVSKDKLEKAKPKGRESAVRGPGVGEKGCMSAITETGLWQSWLKVSLLPWWWAMKSTMRSPQMCPWCIYFCLNSLNIVLTPKHRVSSSQWTLFLPAKNSKLKNFSKWIGSTSYD